MKVFGFLRSPKLALGLCILIAVQAALGTPLPAGRAAEFVRERLGEGTLAAARFLGLVDTYASPLFISLLLLLALNVAFCTGHRLALARRVRSRWGAGPLLDALMHLSIIVLLAGGALKAGLGVVGTQYLFPSEVATTFLAGAAGVETPLGFGLLLKERSEDHYPAAFQIGVRDARSGAAIALLTVREGREAAVPGTGLRLLVGPTEGDGRRVKVRATGAGETGEILLETIPGGATAARFGNYEIVMVTWRRDLRMVRGRVAVIEGGREVREEWLAVGGRIAHRGTSVFLTAWGEDEFRNRYLGIQVTRDPGAPLFWAGATLLAVTMPPFLFARRRPRPDGGYFSRTTAQEGGGKEVEG